MDDPASSFFFLFQNIDGSAAINLTEALWKFGLLFALVAGVAGDAAKHRFAGLGRVVREELLVDSLGHLEHAARSQLFGLLVRREIAANVAGAASYSKSLSYEVHLLLELWREETCQDLYGRAVDHGRRRGLR